MTTNGWKRRDNTSPAAKARAAEYASPQYRATRARLKAQVEAGEAYCWRCGRWIAPGSDWHVGHDDHDRTVIRGPEEARCNLKAASRKGALVANARRKARKAGLLPPEPRPQAPPRCRPHLAAGVTDCGGIHSEAW